MSKEGKENPPESLHDKLCKELGVDDDEDKATLDAEYKRAEYIRRRREEEEKGREPKKERKRLFAR